MIPFLRTVLLMFLLGSYVGEARLGAHPGEIDLTFAPQTATGQAITRLSSSHNHLSAVAVQPDGSAVIAGAVGDMSADQPVYIVMRFQANGLVDLRFGDHGRAKAPAREGIGGVRMNAVALQADGKIVVAGSSHNGVSRVTTILRYDTAGALDPTFGVDGVVVNLITEGDSEAYAVAIHADGRVTAAGYAVVGGSAKLAINRYLSNGNADDSFGTEGSVITTIKTGEMKACALALQPGEKALIASHLAADSGPPGVVLARFLVDGALDPAFGTEGIAVGPPAGYSYYYFPNGFEFALQNDGKILLAGNSLSLDDREFCLFRYHGDGTPDADFGSGGKIVTPFEGNYLRCTDVIVQPNGRIVTVGVADGNVLMARYYPDGSLDSSFGDGGKVITGGEPMIEMHARAIALLPSGEFVVAGTLWFGIGSGQFALMRYDANGVHDQAFGAGGRVRTDVGDNTSDAAWDVAIQADQKILVVGDSYSSEAWAFSIVRYERDGVPDAAFGNDGRVIIPIFGKADIATGVAEQKDHRIVIAGTAGADDVTGSDFALVRLNSDGSLDSTFGTGGKVVTARLGNQSASGLLLQPDGKIVVAGRFENETSAGVILMRYDKNGTLDPTFGTDGIVQTDVDSPAWAVELALQQDGKIVVTTRGEGIGEVQLIVLRYRPNGSLDREFGTGGKVVSPLPGTTYSRVAIALQADDKVVVATDSRNGDDTRTALLTRYDSDGRPDPNFGAGAPVAISLGKGPNSLSTQDLAVQWNGKIVLLAAGADADFGGIALIRLNPDGSADSTFGSAGKSATNYETGAYEATSMALQSGGQIIVAGRHWLADRPDIFVGRFEGDGPDPTPDDGSNPTDLEYTPDAIEQHGNIVFLLSKEHRAVFRWSIPLRRYLSTYALTGAPRCMAYSAELDRLYFAYEGGRITRLAASGGEAETVFADLPATAQQLQTAGEFLFVGGNVHAIYAADGSLVSERASSATSLDYTWSAPNRRMYGMSTATPTELFADRINEAGLITGEVNSPREGESLHRQPIRVAPDGSVVLLGNGDLYHGTTLERLGALSLHQPAISAGESDTLPAVIDGAWLSAQLYTASPLFLPGTLIPIAGRIDCWTNSAEIRASARFPLIPLRVFAAGGNLLVIAMQSNRPAFTLLDADLQVVHSEFAPTDLAQYAGTYLAPISSTPGTVLSERLSGSVRLNIGANGHATGLLRIMGRSVPFLVQFDGTGRASASVAVKGKTLALTFDLATIASGPRLVGSCEAGSIAVEFQGARSLQLATPARHLFRVVNDEPGDAAPAFIASGAMMVSANGTVRVTSRLLLGGPVAQGAQLLEDGSAMLDLVPPSRAAFLGGSVFLSNSDAVYTSGSLEYFQAPNPRRSRYPAGIDTRGELLGTVHRVQKPPLPSAAPRYLVSLFLSGGNLNSDRTITARLLSSGLLLSPSNSSSAIGSINPNTGLVSGFFTHPGTRQSTVFQGVIDHISGEAHGGFLGPTKGGTVMIAPYVPTPF